MHNLHGAGKAFPFDEPHRHINDRAEFVELPLPEDYAALPPPVLEACGFYSINAVGRDNGSVYVFQTNADGTPTFGILATSDGSDACVAVYGASGEVLGAALLDRLQLKVEWKDPAAVRPRAGIEGFEPD